MYSQSFLLAVLITITACFFTPMLLLMWLMAKRRAKRVIFMLLFGVFARLACLIVQFPASKILNEISAIGDMGSLLITQTIFGVTTVLVLWGMLRLLKKDGLNYNRVFTISLGFSALEVMVGTGMAYIARLMSIVSIQDGSIYEMYGSEEAAQIIDDIDSIGVIGAMMDASSAITTIFLMAAVILIVLFSMAKNKMKTIFPILMCGVVVKNIVSALIKLGTLGVLSIIFDLIVLGFSIVTIMKMMKIEKEIMIKPESMNK